MTSGVYPRKPIEERFWAKVDKTDSCWLWTGFINTNGYGRFSPKHGHGTYAHRFVYELTNGVILPELEIDHLCRIRHCVRPSHLDAVTHRINLLRGDTFVARNAAKTHCPHGHEYTRENTAYNKGQRVCKECHRVRQAAWLAKQEKVLS